jgi:peptidoglycan/LPS O-acetylase OafA/YrhL
MGNLSFPLYLVHVPMIWLAVHWAGAGLSGKFCALLLSIIATSVLYRFVDRPIEAWRSGLWRETRRDTAAATSRQSPS